MYDPCYKNITTALNEFVKKPIVPDGIKCLFHIQKKHPRRLTPTPLVLNMPYNSVEVVKSRVFYSKAKLMILKNVLGRNKCILDVSE
jgi:hypothetical protein